MTNFFLGFAAGYVTACLVGLWKEWRHKSAYDCSTTYVDPAVKSVAVYNRAMTDDEMVKMTKGDK